MLGTYFYHEILRKTVISFGTLFNDIHIRHKDNTGKSISDMKVALAYGPMQKFLARIEQQPDLNRATQITLPRMSFEMTNIAYDATRKSSITQTFKASDGTNLRKVFMPVPYNIGFELNILVKLNDDGLQIIEQILPFFQPSFNLTVDLVKAIGEKRDIPMVLESVTFDDNYDVLEPPTTPGSNVSLYFPHDEWDYLLGDNFSTDTRPEVILTDTMQVWDLEVRSTDAGEATLTFVFNDVPDVPVILENTATGVRQTLSNNSTLFCG